MDSHAQGLIFVAVSLLVALVLTIAPLSAGLADAGVDILAARNARKRWNCPVLVGRHNPGYSAWHGVGAECVFAGRRRLYYSNILPTAADVQFAKAGGADCPAGVVPHSCRSVGAKFKRRFSDALVGFSAGILHRLTLVFPAPDDVVVAACVCGLLI